RAAYARGCSTCGTLAKRHFKRRGLDVPASCWEQLRFDPFCRLQEGTFAAVLAPIRDVFSLEVVGVHKIALHLDGTNVRRADGRKLKKSQGRVKGATIMLGRAGKELAICEGLETAIAITMGDLTPGSCPVWALTGAH